MLGLLRSRRAPALEAALRFFHNKRGIAGVEYALILVSILLVAAAGFNMLGQKVDCTTKAATAQLGAGGGGACAGAVAGGAAAGTAGAGGNLNGPGGTVGAVNGTFNGSPGLPGAGGDGSGGAAVAGGGAGGAAGGAGTAAGAGGGGGDASIASLGAFTAKYGGNFKTPGELAVAWKVYQESNNPAQINVIGRRDDTAVAKSWPGHDVLDTQGWTPAVNDAWIQGGIDRGATFYLGSNPGGPNFNNPPGSTHPSTVFKREYDQLLAAGYTKHGNEMWPPSRR
ncbi:MAG: hypothetical protein ABIP39_13715 [Polyangiaceae bacterium]